MAINFHVINLEENDNSSIKHQAIILKIIYETNYYDLVNLVTLFFETILHYPVNI